MSVYDTLTSDPAALMNDETQRAVLDYINKNFTTSGMDDVAYFANREFLAKEQDRKMKENAARMVRDGLARKWNNGEYVDNNGKTVYSDGEFLKKHISDLEDYNNVKSIVGSRERYDKLSGLLNRQNQQKQIEARQARWRSVGRNDLADELESQRLAVAAQNEQELAEFGPETVQRFADSRKTILERRTPDFVKGIGAYIADKAVGDGALAGTMAIQSAGGRIDPINPNYDISTERRGMAENTAEFFADKGNIPIYGTLFAAETAAKMIQSAKRAEMGSEYYKSAFRKLMPDAPKRQIELMAENAELSDRNNVTRYMNALREQELRGDTRAGTVLRTFLDSTPYMIDFMLTGGASGSLAAGVKMLTKKGLKEAAKTVTAKGVKEAAKNAAKEFARMNVRALPLTAVRAGQRGLERYRDAGMGLDEEGNPVFDESADLGGSMVSGAVEAATETAGEAFGELFAPAGKLLSKASGRLLGGKVPNRVLKIVAKAKRKLPYPRILDQARKLGFHGTVGEVAEEFNTAWMNAAAGLDSRDPGIVNRMAEATPSREETENMFMAFAMTSLGLRGVQGSLDFMNNRKYRRLHRDLSALGRAIDSEAKTPREAEAAKLEVVNGLAADLKNNAAEKEQKQVSEPQEPKEQTHEQEPVPEAQEQTQEAELKEQEEEEISSGDFPVQSVPVSSLKIDPERFQFKSGADKVSGVDSSNQIGGTFDPKTAGNLLVWEDKNGERFVVNGHHRFKLAKDTGVKNVNVIIEREADGVSAEEARKHGVLTNIRDGQGSVQDYAEFVRAENMDESAAEREGILAREKGRRGFTIGKFSTDNLFSLVKDGSISPGSAAVIADVARKDEALEAAGIAATIKKNMSDAQLKGYLQLLSRTDRTSNADADLFGFDDSAVKKAEELSRLAAKHIREVGERVRVAKNAVRNPEAAGKMDVNVGKNAQNMLNDALTEQKRWENWYTDSELYHQLEEELSRKEKKAESAGSVDPLNRALQGKYGKTVSVRTAEPANKAQKAVRDFFRKEFETDVEFFDTDSLKADGFLHDGKIYLNRAGQKPMMVSAFHEFTHQMRLDSPEEFQKLLSSVTAISGKQELADWKKNYNEKYRSAGYSELDDGALEEEFIADVVGGMGGNAEFLKRLAGENKGILERFLEWIRNLRSLLTEKGYGRDVERVIGKQLDNAVREVEFALKKRMSDKSDGVGREHTEKKPAGAEAGQERTGTDKTDKTDGAVRERVEEKKEEKPEVLTSVFVDQYLKRFGNVLSSDNIKLMFRDRGYDPHDEESIRDFHKRTGPWVGRMFDIFLRTRKGKGNRSVVFTGGGNGSGKSSVLNEDFARNADFVMDSAMVNLSAARESIQKVIDNGQLPNLAFVYRDPREAWFNGVQKRNTDADGHTVPKSTFVNTHSKARENFLKLLEEFGGKVKYIIRDNSSDGETISLEELKAKPVYTKEQILEMINGEADSDRGRMGGIHERSQRANGETVESGSSPVQAVLDRGNEGGGSQRGAETTSERTSGSNSDQDAIKGRKGSLQESENQTGYVSRGLHPSRAAANGEEEDGGSQREAETTSTGLSGETGESSEAVTEEVKKPSGGSGLTLDFILDKDLSASGKASLMKKYALDQKITLKEAQERMEELVVRRSREIAGDPANDMNKAFNKILTLYKSMPNLNERTSTSMRNQAYSTPVPLAYLLGRAIGLPDAKRVYEPTAGNGALLITAKPESVQANEIEPIRNGILKTFGFPSVTSADATNFSPDGTQDAIIMNPPFGRLEKKVDFDGFKIAKLEHLIALQALKSLDKNGTAALILGAADKIEPKVNESEKPFLNYLYDHFNIADSFEVSGELYRKQGAGYPIRVIILNGRKETSDFSTDFSSKPVERLTNWIYVFNRLKGVEHELTAWRKTHAPEWGETGERRFEHTAVGDGRPAENARGGETLFAESDLEHDRTVRGGERRGSDDRASQQSTAGEVSGTSDHLSRGGDSDSGLGLGSVVRDGSEMGSEHGGGTSGVAGGSESGGLRSVLADSGDNSVREAEPENADTAPEFSEDGLQAKYKTQSKSEALGTLIPKFLLPYTQKALQNIREKHGSVDDFVRSQLGYGSNGELYGALAAEQIDSIALAIDNIQNGEPVIIGDQTGIGKGRQAAAIMRYAKQNGFTPIFVTEKPKLFSDMYFDGKDIGETFHPFLISEKHASSIIGRDNETIQKTLPNPSAYFSKMLTDNPQGFDSVFIVYSQLNKQGNPQQKFLSELIETKPCILVMDEAHNASGEQSNTAVFFKGLVGGHNLKGTVYLSATYAKRPENMMLFLGEKFKEKFPNILDVLKKGGLAAQQIVCQGLAEAGRLIRRERDFSGVKVNIGDFVPTSARIKREYDEMASVMSDMVRLSMDIKEYAKDKNGAKGGKKMEETLRSGEFASKVHNYISQLLFATKLDASLEKIIAAHKSGQKPVIAVANTMESFLERYVTRHGIANGTSVGVSFKDILKFAIDDLNYGTIKDRTGNEREIKLNLPPQIRAEMEETIQNIDKLNVDLPASPIDYIKAKLAASGITVGELTGRTKIIHYDENGKNGILGERSEKEKKSANSVVNDFNSGKLDCIILNRSGSTGLSLHASEKFKDQRQRHMIIVQADLDINVVMQTLGRVMRSGQVVKPEYTFVATDLEAERRVMAILNKKLASLNANTTANTKGAMSFGNVDILNKYGDQVVADYLTENLMLAGRMNMKVTIGSDGRIKAKEDLARDFTGKMAVLPNAMQKAIYQDLDESYADLTYRMKVLGEYDLEVMEKDWSAEEQNSELYTPGNENGTIFDKPLMLKTYKTTERIRVPDRKALLEDRKKQFGSDDISKMRQKVKQQFREQREKLEEYFQQSAGSTEKQSDAAMRKKQAEYELAKIESHVMNILGYPVSISFGENSYRGTLSCVKFARNGNPGARSNIKLSFLTESPVRITIPLSQIGNKTGQSKINHLADSLDDIFNERSSRIVENTRKIYVGNIIKGVDASEGFGKVVKFTLKNGKTETGVALPAGFSMDSLSRDPRRKLSTVDEVMDYFDKGGYSAQITGADFGLKIHSNFIETDTKRSSGGQIFLDPEITNITGDFRKMANTMRVYHYGNKDILRKVLPILLKKTQLSGDLELVSKIRENSGDILLDVQDKPDGVGQDGRAEYPRNRMADENTPVNIVEVTNPVHLTTSMAQNILKKRIEEEKKRTGKNYLEAKNKSPIGMTARIDYDSSYKMKSGKATNKSSVKPYVHAVAMVNIKKLFENAMLGVSHSDRKNEENVLQMHRFYVGMKYEDQLYGIKISVKEKRNTGNHIYSIEAHDLEIYAIKNPESVKPTGDMSGQSPDIQAPHKTWAEPQPPRLWQILHFNDFFEKFDPLNDLLGSEYSILRDSGKVKENSEKISLSIQDPEIRKTVRSGIRWLSNAKEFASMKDENAKADISKFAPLLGTVMYYSEKIPAYKKIFDASQKFEEDTYRLKEAVFGVDESDLRRVMELKKNPEEYRKFSNYVFQRDLDANGGSVHKAEKGLFNALDSNGAFIKTLDNEEDAWKAVWKDEADNLMKNGESREFADAVQAYRQMNARVYDILRSRAESVEKVLNDLEVESVEINDLFKELKKMGDRRGYYMPRLRHGRYILEAAKEGENPRLEIFDTKAARSARAATLKEQGFTDFHFRVSATPSNSAFEDMSLLGMNDILTSAFDDVAGKAKKSFEEFGLDASWMDYVRKDGETERHFVVRGRLNQEQIKVFKEFGGRFYSKMKEWHFVAPEEGYNIDRLLLASMNANSSETKAAIAFGNALSAQLSVLIHSHGSRSRKIRRSDAVGKDVYLGYEEDPVRALVMSASATAAGTAKSEMAKTMLEAFTGRDLKWTQFRDENMPEGLNPGDKQYMETLVRLFREYDKEVEKRRIDSAKQPEAYKDAKEYIREMLRNQEPSERVFGFIRGIAALKYLSRISTGIVNLSTLITNVPAVFHAEAKIKFHEALKQLGVSARLYGNYQMYRKFGKGKRPAVEDQWLFNEISNRGWDVSLVNKEATGVLRTWFGNKWKFISEKMMIAMEMTERFNRAITIAAGYKALAAQENGAISESRKIELLKEAKRISDKAHGIYGKTNLPAWTRGSSIGAQSLRAFYVFKPYGHNYMQELYNIGVNQRDRKAFAWMLLSPMILAGPTATIAWNFMPAAVRAICTVLRIEPPDDPEEALYQFVEDEFGGYAGRVARYGAIGGLGINVAPSMSMMFTKDSIPQTIWDLFGAPGAVVKDVAQGTKNIANGDFIKGLEKLSPAMLSAPIRAIRESTEGVTMNNNQPVFYGNKPLRSTVPQSIARAFGFNPAGLSEKRDRQWSERLTAREYSSRRTEIYTKLRRYYLNPNRTVEDYTELIDMIREYNAKVRRNRPVGVNLITSRQLRTLRKRMLVPGKMERMRKVVNE